jgi:hypothetical protein
MNLPPQPSFVLKSMPIISALIVGILIAYGAPDGAGWMGYPIGLLVLFLCSLSQYSGFKAGGAVMASASHQFISNTISEFTHTNTDASAAITKAENNIVSSLNEIGAAFSQLPQMHNTEAQTFASQIRVCQAIVYARTGLRSAIAFEEVDKRKNP